MADEGGDPFIFSRASGVILHAFHGEGLWEPSELFMNLSEMATTFAILGDIAASAGLSLTDDDSLILEQYLHEAAARIDQFIGSPVRANTILSTLGWGQGA